jgi:PASTA domain
VNRLLSSTLVATLAVAVLALGLAAPIPAALADPTPEGAVAELNTWRTELGESPVSTNTVAAWNTGCNHHDNYEHLNGNLPTHLENSGNPGYTTDGAEAGTDSVLSTFVSAPSPAADAALLPGPTWDPEVFHRAHLLQPRLGQIGFDSSTFLNEGAYHSFDCLWLQNQPAEPGPPQALDNTRTTSGLTLYPSPGNGAYSVPPSFPAGTESPDPATETGVPAGATLGWLLNVEIDGPWESSGYGYAVAAHEVTATLAPDGTSNYVPLVVSQCGPQGCGNAGGTSLGTYFEGGFGIFPTQPLAANTVYRVVLTGGTVTDFTTDTNYPIPAGYSWCFSTASTYTPSADCAPPTSAAEEPANLNASTALSLGGSGSGGGTVRHCVVPKLKGRKLAASRKKLAAVDCKLGEVRKRHGSTARSGRVVKQSAKPGKVLPAGSKIGLILAGGASKRSK